MKQRDGSFYKPRDDSMFSDLQELKNIELSDEESGAGAPAPNKIKAQAEQALKKPAASESIHSA